MIYISLNHKQVGLVVIIMFSDTINGDNAENTYVITTKTIEGVTGWTNSAGINGYNYAYSISNSNVSYTLTWN
jgi:hypothetical protein|tara:strand:+ start:87 stop:305 length:219 start_codon:yes stop_codon:yes gene_type:complete